MNQTSEGKAGGKGLREKMAILLREPFVHFMVIGIAVYFLYGFYAGQVTSESENTITITAAEIDWLEQTWQKRWNRPPTSGERQGLIDTYVKESVMYQQALAMGLDSGDTIIRRRLAQKLEFLTRDLTEIPSPSKEEIRVYFDMNQDKYRSPVVLSFTHIYFSPDKRGKQTVADVTDALAKLQSEDEFTQSFKEMGDAFMLQQYYPEKTEQEILRLFGTEFSSETFQLPTGKWTGPVESGYGLHLVYVHDRVESTMPDLDDIQDRVLEDWVADKRRDINEKFYAALLDRYEVIVEEGTDEKMSKSKELQ
jgi:hypothetical protein